MLGVLQHSERGVLCISRCRLPCELLSACLAERREFLEFLCQYYPKLLKLCSKRHVLRISHLGLQCELVCEGLAEIASTEPALI